MNARRRPLALWSTNLIGATIALIAMGVITATELYPAWSDYRDTVVPAFVVPKKAELNAYGQTWQLRSVRRVSETPRNTYGDQLPKDTVLLVITIDRSGSPPGIGCVGMVVDGKRRWRDQGVGAFGVRTADGATTLCSEPGALQFSFLLPADAEPTAVDIVRNDNRILLRLLL